MKNLTKAGRRVPPSQSYKPRDLRVARYPLVPNGTPFGYWTVLENDLRKKVGRKTLRYCRVRCKCGKEADVLYGTLRNGRSNSCGCRKMENIGRSNAARHALIPVGSEFGWLVVLKNDMKIGFKTGSVRACLVRCRCGKEGVSPYGNLRRSHCQSCGCKAREHTLERVWNALYAHTRSRGREFHLTLPQFQLISKMNCFYCGKEPANIHRVRYKVGGVFQTGVDPSTEIRYSGLDRVDSSKGYVAGNLVPCCFGCNRMKSALPLDEFYAIMERIRLHGSTVAGIHEQAAAMFDSLA
jgi:hypothetical protein